MSPGRVVARDTRAPWRVSRTPTSPPAGNLSSSCRPGIAAPAAPPEGPLETVSRQACRPSINTPGVQDGGSSEGTINGGAVGQAPARVPSDHQPFPNYGPLHAHLDLTLEQLAEALCNGPRGDVYVYVVETVDLRGRQFAQSGNSPNFQGGVVTLCACKHQMRSWAAFSRSGQPLWIAGVTRSGLVDGRRCRYLFYLMYVPLTHRFRSQAEMWESLPPETRQAKSAAFSPLGDIYEPLHEGLRGEAALAVENYRPPCSEHGHLRDGTWPEDINKRNRSGGRPHMLRGDPGHSFLWTRPAIRLNESLPLAREPGWYRSKDEFANDLVLEQR
jgi:hypothetical protein